MNFENTFKNVKEHENLSNDKGAVITDQLKTFSEIIDDEVTNSLLNELVLNYAGSERKLVELNELKNRFLGIAAHDLRNPLSLIKGFSELIIRGDDSKIDSDYKRYIKMMHKVSIHMLSLINDLLDVSVIESGNLNLCFEKYSLKDVALDQLEILIPIAKNKDITIQTDFVGNMETSFDKKSIKQVLDNIIGNSIKFSENEKNIFLSVKSNEWYLTISIKDEGPGISNEDHSKLFKPFQKLSALPTAGEKSTGLGLLIVKKIIDAHNGKIEVESKEGKGTIFNVFLPVA